MDDNGQRENGRHKSDHYKGIHAQWMIPQNQMKDHNHTMKIMNIIKDRDRAIEERNLALSEKKAALAERDMAILQRDAAITERNNAIVERDSAISALQFARENSNASGGSACPPGCMAARSGVKHINHHQHHTSHINSTPHLSDGPFNGAREMHITEAYPISSLPENSAKPRRGKTPKKEPKIQSVPSNKRTTTKTPRKNKRGGEDLNKQVTIAKSPWRGQQVFGNGEDLNKLVSAGDLEWRGQDLGLNQVTFDEATMPVPGCSCTGTLRQCYKWGNGGWQSSCCTTTMSVYPLPVMPNKRHARVGGRKMSGSAFTKLLSRLAREGHDLSVPLDLKDHWAKHGTNRYITIK